MSVRAIAISGSGQLLGLQPALSPLDRSRLPAHSSAANATTSGNSNPSICGASARLSSTGDRVRWGVCLTGGGAYSLAPVGMRSSPRFYRSVPARGIDYLLIGVFRAAVVL